MTPEGLRPLPESNGAPDPGRTERLNEAMELLISGFDTILEQDGFQRYLQTMARFHRYSYSNTLLIMTQQPEATLVAGYHQWQQQGRQVRRGERGIRILVPYKARVNPEDEDESDEEVEYVTRGFGVGHVFDISQTEGDPLPAAPSPQELEGASAAGEWVSSQLGALLARRGIALEEAELNGPKGVYRPGSRTIMLQAGMRPDQTLKTLCHETAHAVADHTVGIHRRDAETVAEAASYVVLQHYGIDSGTYSFPYLAAWAGDRGVLTRNLAGIQRVSHEILGELEPGAE